MGPTHGNRIVVLLAALALLLSIGCATTDRIKPTKERAEDDKSTTAKDKAGPDREAQPRFENLVTLSGQPTRLADHRKKVTVLVMWATYCAPCIAEMPFVEALYQKYKADPEVAILSVCAEPAIEPKQLESRQAIVEKKGLTAPVLVDPDLQLMMHLCSLIPSAAGAPAEKTGDKTSEQTFALPLNAIIDEGFKAHLFTGLAEGLTEESYVEKLSGLIELARKGALPDSPTPEAAPSPAETGKPEQLMMKFGAELTTKERLAKLPDIRKILTKHFPYLSPAQLDGLHKQAEKQLHESNTISLEVPPPAGAGPGTAALQPPEGGFATPEASGGKPGDMNIRLPQEFTLEQRIGNLPSIRGLLTRTNPHLSPEQLDALMKKVEEQLRAGPVVSLKIPSAADPRLDALLVIREMRGEKSEGGWPLCSPYRLEKAQTLDRQPKQSKLCMRGKRRAIAIYTSVSPGSGWVHGHYVLPE